jgi:hypothetical protein
LLSGRLRLALRVLSGPHTEVNAMLIVRLVLLAASAVGFLGVLAQHFAALGLALVDPWMR